MKICLRDRFGRALKLWAVGCLVVGLGASPALAQKPTKPDAKGKPNQNAPGGNAAGVNPAAGGSTMEIAKSEGKLEAIQGNMIKIADTTNKELFLVVSQETAFKFSGEADPKWLTPGVMVRFTTMFENGKPTGTLSQLEVFTPVMNNRMTMEQMRDQTPGIYQEGKSSPEGAKGLFTEQKKSLKNPEKTADKKSTAKDDKKKDAAATSGAGAQSMRVVGKLLGVQGNTLNIVATQPLQIELATDAKIAVVTSDVSAAINLVTKGDSVTVSGLRDPAQPAYLQAERLEVKAAKKLEAAQMPTRGRTTSRGKDAADAKDSKDPKGKPDAKDPKGKSVKGAN